MNSNPAKESASSFKLEALFQPPGEQSNLPPEDKDTFLEYFRQLKQAGYLRMSLPGTFGGKEMSMAKITQQLRKLAYYAPTLALAVNGHFIWTGLAAEMWGEGDKSLEWLLREVRADKVLAAGHVEPGNSNTYHSLPTRAEKVLGGYRFFGKQDWSSPTPVWSYLCLQGRDNPRNVFAFLARDSSGYYEIRNGMLGMQAMSLKDTVYLDGVYIPDQYIAYVADVERSDNDPFVSRLCAWTTLSFANLYYGQAMRVIDLIKEDLDAQNTPYPKWKDLTLDLESLRPKLDQATRESVKVTLAAGCQALLTRATELAKGIGIK